MPRTLKTVIPRCEHCGGNIVAVQTLERHHVVQSIDVLFEGNVVLNVENIRLSRYHVEDPSPSGSTYQCQQCGAHLDPKNCRGITINEVKSAVDVCTTEEICKKSNSSARKTPSQ